VSAPWSAESSACRSTRRGSGDERGHARRDDRGQHDVARQQAADSGHYRSVAQADRDHVCPVGPRHQHQQKGHQPERGEDQQLYDEHLATLPGVQRLSSTLVMKSLVEARPLPL